MADPITPPVVAPATPVVATPVSPVSTTPPVAASPVSTTPPASILSEAGKELVTKVDSPQSILTEAKVEGAKEGETKTEPAKAASTVPEKYDIKAPEGMTLDEAKLAKFSEVAKEIGLSNEGAQKLVDFQANIIKEQAQIADAAFSKAKEDFRQETIKEFGPKLKDELIYVAKGRDNLASPALVKLFEDMGLSNNVEVIKLFSKAGRQLSEGRLVDGKTTVSGPKSDGEILYPNLAKR